MENNLEDKMASILNNPELMQQIIGMAQSIGQATQNETEKQAPNPSLEFDQAALSRIVNLVKGNEIDKNQQALLNALIPYLPKNRVNKLENAMRAAKISKLATTFLGNSGFQLLSSR